jgi:ABC-type transporter Mla subunit MlaD
MNDEIKVVETKIDTHIKNTIDHFNGLFSALRSYVENNETPLHQVQTDVLAVTDKVIQIEMDIKAII